MKKLIIALLLISVSAFADYDYFEESKAVELLTDKICKIIVDYERNLIKNGFVVDGVCWTPMHRLKRGMNLSFPFELKENVTYIFYTCTTAKSIYVYITSDGSYRGAEPVYENSGGNIVFKFKPKYTGNYHYNIKNFNENYDLVKSFVSEVK